MAVEKHIRPPDRLPIITEPLFYDTTVILTDYERKVHSLLEAITFRRKTPMERNSDVRQQATEKVRELSSGLGITRPLQLVTLRHEFYRALKRQEEEIWQASNALPDLFF